MTRCKINNEEMVIKGIDEIPMFSWNTKTKEFYVLGHKFDGVNSIEDFINFINNLQQENEKLKEQYCERTDCSGRLGNSKKVEELIKENEKLNHYKLLYQKVKERNMEAIEYLGSKKYFEFNYNPECPWDWEQPQKDLLEILEGYNEVSND